MAHCTLHFLNGVLSQGGPSGLPYAEPTKWHIRKHFLHLAEAYDSLKPKTAVFTHQDGRTVNLLGAEGSVPMTFQGFAYDIPVVIWLMESYPHRAPSVFVKPTRDMTIKQPHPFVFPDGVVSIPYLQSWVYPSSNLVELVRNLSVFFSRDPPLYSQRKSPNSVFAHRSPNLNSGYGGVVSPSTSPAIPPTVHTPLPTPPPPYVVCGGAGRRVTEDPSDILKMIASATNKLLEHLSFDIREVRKSSTTEMEWLLNVQSVLRKWKENLKNGLKEMNDEREALEQNLQSVLTNSDVLERWLRENVDGSLKNLNNLIVHEVYYESCNALSNQLLDCMASDMAIEDAIYALDKAAHEGAVPFDLYMKNVRLLSREQFFDRATASKVRAVQMQAQVASMASSVPHQLAVS